MRKTSYDILAVLCGFLSWGGSTFASVVSGPIVNPANGHFYYLLSPNTWTGSEAEAIALYGHLVTINDKTEDDWVFNTFSRPGQYGLWIGLTDQYREGAWVWASGYTGPYWNWDARQPDNNGGEHYCMIFVEEFGSPSPRARKWNDLRDTALEWDTSGGVLQGVVEVATPDLVAVGLNWNSTTGSLDCRYRVDGGILNTGTTAKLFWANGTSAGNIFSSTPIFTEDITAGTGGPGSSGVITFNVPASALADPAVGATHVLLVLDYDPALPYGFVQEEDETNNYAAIELCPTELLDAMTFQEAGVLPTDAAAYGTGGQPRIGAVADGASRLVVRVDLHGLDISDPTLNLHFTVSGGGSQGLLRPIDTDSWTTDVQAACATLAGGSKALCIYESPVDFPESGPRATVQLLNGTVVIAAKEIQIKRPPIVLVHGIWSSAQKAWVETGAKEYIEDRLGPSADGFPVSAADYEWTSSEEFEVNFPLVWAAIRKATGAASPSYACSKVDVVGHSMGALLARLVIHRYGQLPQNYFKGNVHKLISIGTPHRGSFLADQLILARRENPKRFAVLAKAMSVKGMYVDRGAADNLCAYIGYSGISNILQTGVPSHAIVSSCDYPVGLQDDLLRLYIALEYFLPDYADPRCSTSDAVVDVTSQAGGLTGGAVTRFLSTAQHTKQTRSEAIQARVFRLLGAPIASSGWFDMEGFRYFGGTTLPSFARSPGYRHRVAASSGSDTVGSWLVVDGISDGQIVRPNDVLEFTARADDNRVLQRIALIGGTNTIELEAEPFSCHFVIPATAAGDLPIVLLATDLDGEPSLKILTLRVSPNAAVESLSATAASIQLYTTNGFHLRVFGKFDDGVIRDITSANSGTFYGSGDPLRVSVDADGVLTGLRNTSTPVTISITNGAAWSNVQAKVDIMNLPPRAVISSSFTNATYSVPMTIPLDGSLSSDPESSPLNYHWDFGDGTTSAQRIPPPHTFSQPGQYIVRLVVTDSDGLNGTGEFLVRGTPSVHLEIQQTSGQSHVRLFAETGMAHILETSTNLQNWVPVATNAPWNGSLSFLDTNLLGFQQRFYRLRGTASTPRARLGLSMVGLTNAVELGSNITYSVRVANLGPIAAAGVVLTDTLPAGVAFVNAQASQGACTFSGGTLTCHLGVLDVASGATATIVLAATECVTISNSVAVLVAQADSNTSDYAVTVVTEVGLAIPSNEPIVGWGYNYFGQTNVPSGLSNAVAVAAGHLHSLALRTDGTVVAWGYNGYGQTNVPSGLTNVVAVAAGRSHNLALRTDGTVVGWGDSSYGLTKVPSGLTNVVAVAAGQSHNLTLRSDGTVVAWGYNGYGQTNVPSGLTNVVAVAAGQFHNLALRTDGTVVGWGNNGVGQTNVPSGLSNVVAVAAGQSHSLALRTDGTVVGWGSNAFGQTNVPSGLTNVVAVAAGSLHNLALKPLRVWTKCP